MRANNVKEENLPEDLVGSFCECVGTRKETDLRKIRPTGRFEAGTSHGLPWSEKAHSDALRSGVAVDQVSTLEGGTGAKPPQTTTPVGIYSNGGGDLDPWGSTASSPTRSILRSQDHPIHPRLGEEQSKRVAIHDSNTRSVSSRSSSLSCRSGQSVALRRSGQSLKEKTKREALEHLATRIKGLEKTQDELKKKV